MLLTCSALSPLAFVAFRDREESVSLPGAFLHGQSYDLTVGIDRTCEQQKQGQEEFYATAFRKKLYYSLEELQADLDDWLAEYNRTRPHSGKYCYGKTPMQTFLDSVSLAREKMLDSVSTLAPEPERSPAQRSAGGGAVADAAA